MRKLQQKLMSQFDSSVRHRGFVYFREGAVRLELNTFTRVQAQVIGSQYYQVVVDWTHLAKLQVLDVGCTCPYFSEGVIVNIFGL